MSEQGQFEINDTILVPSLLGPEALEPRVAPVFLKRELNLAGGGQTDHLLGGGCDLTTVTDEIGLLAFQLLRRATAMSFDRRTLQLPPIRHAFTSALM